jgi:Protein of unknown function (DUF3127).
MQIKVKLVQILPLQSGVGKNGEWKKQDIIGEITDSQYPKKVCISIWGDKVNPSQLQVGNDLIVDFDIESREFNGRWYTDVKAWKVEAVSMPGAQPPSALPDYNHSEIPPEAPAPEFNDLPF